MSQINITKEIERLLQFAVNRCMLEALDVIPARNALMELLGVAEPYTFDDITESELLESPVVILENILDYVAQTGGLPDNNPTYRDLLDAKIMGLLMPRQSEVANRFWKTAKEQSILQAVNDYYELSKNSNYIRMDRIKKNEYWLTATEYGDLEITINLSKPEKDPKQIAIERSMPHSYYPKCLLCVENVGYAGRLNHPARQNHRVIPLELDGNPWFFQYSPYVYYNEHSIIFSKDHSPMKISDNTFVRLLDFVSQFPHYFVGSNADLPIVGGSILNHDHFQGGKHRFPMEIAKADKVFSHPEYEGVKAAIIKWPMSVIRISGSSRRLLAELSSAILSEWRGYSDPSAGVFAFSDQNGKQVPHNTITPISRINKDGDYELDLVLRNNRTSQEHPEGIFHPHKKLHHIKQENIGLIEVMGLAVLPGRLKLEMEQIKSILTGKMQDTTERKENKDHVLHKHNRWIDFLTETYGIQLSEEEAGQCLKNEVGNKFLRVLLDAGVYKREAAGLTAFQSFMKQIGFRS